MKNRNLLVVLWILVAGILFQQPMYAQFWNDSATHKPRLLLGLPVVDVPYWGMGAQTNANRGCVNPNCPVHAGNYVVSLWENPSMLQSLMYTQSVISGVAFGVQTGVNALIPTNTALGRLGNSLLAEFAMFGFNLVGTNQPLGSGWLHEEYHRAAMATRFISSNNPFSRFGTPGGSVSGIQDQYLRDFKAQDPAGFVRMLASGVEAQQLLARSLQVENVIHDTRLPITLYSVYEQIYSALYVTSNALGSADSVVRVVNSRERTVLERDFTGPDFTGWAYHISSPKQPYDSLGTHPTGVGINRYITTERIAAPDLSYFQRVAPLMWLNLASPLTLGINTISLDFLSPGLRMNAAMRAYMTSFGTDVGGEVFVITPEVRGIVGVHNYQNRNSSFWALEAEMFDIPLPIFSAPTTWTARIIAGTQPLNQEHRTLEGQFFGALRVRGNYPISDWFSVFVQSEAKTAGWIAGNPFLGANISLVSGVQVRSPR